MLMGLFSLTTQDEGGKPPSQESTMVEHEARRGSADYSELLSGLGSGLSTDQQVAPASSVKSFNSILESLNFFRAVVEGEVSLDDDEGPSRQESFITRGGLPGSICRLSGGGSPEDSANSQPESSKLPRTNRAYALRSAKTSDENLRKMGLDSEGRGRLIRMDLRSQKNLRRSDPKLKKQTHSTGDTPETNVARVKLGPLGTTGSAWLRKFEEQRKSTPKLDKDERGSDRAVGTSSSNPDGSNRSRNSLEKGKFEPSDISPIQEISKDGDTPSSHTDPVLLNSSPTTTERGDEISNQPGTSPDGDPVVKPVPKLATDLSGEKRLDLLQNRIKALEADVQVMHHRWLAAIEEKDLAVRDYGMKDEELNEATAALLKVQEELKERCKQVELRTRDLHKEMLKSKRLDGELQEFNDKVHNTMDRIKEMRTEIAQNKQELDAAQILTQQCQDQKDQMERDHFLMLSKILVQAGVEFSGTTWDDAFQGVKRAVERCQMAATAAVNTCHQMKEVAQSRTTERNNLQQLLDEALENSSKPNSSVTEQNEPAREPMMEVKERLAARRPVTSTTTFHFTPNPPVTVTTVPVASTRQNTGINSVAPCQPSATATSDPKNPFGVPKTSGSQGMPPATGPVPLWTPHAAFGMPSNYGAQAGFGAFTGFTTDQGIPIYGIPVVSEESQQQSSKHTVPDQLQDSTANAAASAKLSRPRTFEGFPQLYLEHKDLTRFQLDGWKRQLKFKQQDTLSEMEPNDGGRLVLHNTLCHQDLKCRK